MWHYMRHEGYKTKIDIVPVVNQSAAGQLGSTESRETYSQNICESLWLAGCNGTQRRSSNLEGGRRE